MKIERISENQIRCTLSNLDLSVRNMNLSELAYGTEKARNLFKEMVQKASREVGFDAEDIPLMVEAIPMANESVMLIITKIEDPEELDTRFSRFAPSDDEEESSGGLATELLDGADSLLQMFGMTGENDWGIASDEGFNKAVEKMIEKAKDGSLLKEFEKSQEKEHPAKFLRVYQFNSLDAVCEAARGTSKLFAGESVLYKNPSGGKYYLVLKKGDSDELSFSRTCNILSEFGARVKADPASEAYYSEHYETIVKRHAITALAAV